MRIRRAGSWVLVSTLIAAAVTAGIIGGGGGGGGGITCNLNATPANFSAQLSAAVGGNTLCLAAGTYTPSLITVTKSSTVTIRPGEGVAESAAIIFDLQLDDATNLTFDSVTVDGGELRGDPTNIDIINSTFTERYSIKTVTMSNADIDFDNNTHINIDAPISGGGDGRLYLPERNDAALADVRISNSYFSGGNADGILSGANGVTIENNEFDGMVQITGDVAHTDPIQLWGAKNHIVRHNWFHNLNVASAIMIPDGDVTLSTFEDNIIDMTGSGDSRAFNYGGAIGNTLRNNTIIGSFLNRASNQLTPSSGTVFENNIVTGGVTSIEGATFASRINNLVGSGAVAGEITGTPTFVGGGTPTSYAGYCLANGSAGKNAGTDGLDVGIGC